MKISKLIFFLVFIFFGGCTSQYPIASSALEGGSEFINGCLKGDFKKAAAYMIDDAENQKDLLKIKRDYDYKSADNRHGYLTASIIINEDDALTDTVHIINYKNSYDQYARKVKVVQRNGKWLVDFKYTFNGNL